MEIVRQGISSQYMPPHRPPLKIPAADRQSFRCLLIVQYVSGRRTAQRAVRLPAHFDTLSPAAGTLMLLPDDLSYGL